VPPSFRGKDLKKKISQSEKKIAHGNQSGYSEETYRGPSIDASCKILLYLANWFQRRRFLEIDRQETRIDYGSHVC
jgi:hypothetical protein